MKKKGYLILLLVALIALIWFISGFIVYHYFGKDRGTIGDLFSPINALFAGLAFCGITITIYLQQKELSLQRQELVNTREIFQRQKFENTFFQLTNTQQSITNSLHHEYVINTTTSGKPEKRSEVKLDGRKVLWAILIDFRKMHEYILGLDKREPHLHHEGLDTNMRRRFHEYNISAEFSYDIAGNYKDINLRDDAQVTKFLFKKINDFYLDDLSHYYKHLYKILEYINESELSEASLAGSDVEQNEVRVRYQRYADFLEAQLSIPELVIVFYHSSGLAEVKSVMSRFNFFKTLDPALLISPVHGNWHTGGA